jgi:hypothetical protein
VKRHDVYCSDDLPRATREARSPGRTHGDRERSTVSGTDQLFGSVRGEHQRAATHAIGEFGELYRPGDLARDRLRREERGVSGLELRRVRSPRPAIDPAAARQHVQVGFVIAVVVPAGILSPADARIPGPNPAVLERGRARVRVPSAAAACTRASFRTIWIFPIGGPSGTGSPEVFGRSRGDSNGAPTAPQRRRPPPPRDTPGVPRSPGRVLP